MIVRPGDGGVHLITQPDHARLAGRIMAQCAPLQPHPRRESILRAIRDHDNGWAEGDASPTIEPESGAIVDFITAPVDVRQGVWPRAVAALADDPLAAALVAQHAIVAYDRMRPEPAWAAFFVGMTARRDAWLARTDVALEELLSDYVFVRLGDLISLAFCMGKVGLPPFGGWTVAMPGATDTVVVSPDPFAGAVIAIEVEAKLLGQPVFGSDAECQRAFAEAPATMLRGEVKGQAAFDVR